MSPLTDDEKRVHTAFTVTSTFFKQDVKDQYAAVEKTRDPIFLNAVMNSLTGEKPELPVVAAIAENRETWGKTLTRIYNLLEDPAMYANRFSIAWNGKQVHKSTVESTVNEVLYNRNCPSELRVKAASHPLATARITATRFPLPDEVWERLLEDAEPSVRIYLGMSVTAPTHILRKLAVTTPSNENPAQGVIGARRTVRERLASDVEELAKFERELFTSMWGQPTVEGSPRNEERKP